MANYPGGEALYRFNHLYAARDDGTYGSLELQSWCYTNHPGTVHVHVSNLAAQTGASLFLHTHAPPFLPGLDSTPNTKHWTYDKTENLSPKELSAAREITHLIAESEKTASAYNSWYTSSQWTTVDTVDGFDKWSLNPGLRTLLEDGLMENLDVLFHPLEMVKSEKLVILERRSA